VQKGEVSNNNKDEVETERVVSAVPGQVLLQFVTESERLKWHTYLDFLKEKLQLKYFVDKFSGLTPNQQMEQTLAQSQERQLAA